jgi:hypothetical protein
VLVLLVTIAFLGLATAATRILLRPPPDGPAADARRLPPIGNAAAPGPTADPVATAVRTRVRPSPADAAVVAGAPVEAVAPGEPSAWMVVPVLAGALVLLVLGVHPPADLTGLLARAVRELSGVR